jgi:hypothetical protein
MVEHVIYFLSFYISIFNYALSSSIFYTTIGLASTTTVIARTISSFFKVAIINN